MTIPRRFSLIVLLPVSAILPVVLVLSLTLEPLDGDLTRTGGYPEHEFGWNSVQERFSDNLFEYARFESDYVEYRDVVVIGDSYSNHVDVQDRQRRWAWQNYFVNRTGVSLVTFHHDRVTVPELLGVEEFRRAPPKVLIWQSNERALVGRTSGLAGTCEGGASPPVRLERAARGLHPVPYLRIAGLPPRPRAGIATAVHHVKVGLLRRLGRNVATALPYSGPPLFSHRRSDQLLVLAGEAGTNPLSPERLRGIRCGLLNLQSMVQATGETVFIAMVVVDKSTIYGPFLDEPDIRYGSVMGRLQDPASINLVPLESALEGAIQEGTVDLWLPNDSHWGANGHRLASEVLEEFLVGLGVLLPN